MSKIEVDEIVPRSGNNLTVGSSGQTIIVPAGATFNASNSTFTLPDGSIVAAKIASGAITADKISSSIDLSSKTLTLPASAVTAHVTAFDDNKIVNDISTLALRQASDQNKSAYNTNSQSVDVFQDDTGIDTTTNVARNASEYVNSITESFSTPAYETGNRSSTYSSITHANFSVDTGSTIANTWVDGDFSTGSSNSWYFEPIETVTSDFRIVFDLGSGNSKIYTGAKIYLSGASDCGTWVYEGSNNGSNYTALSSNFNWGSSITTETTWSNDTAYRYIRVKGISGSTSNGPWQKEIEFQTKTSSITFNSTGNFTGTTITAPSSVSSMGAIITYQDQSGTNALNTDIVLQLSADGGSNYSTATLTALPDFSTGIKMAKVNDLAVTAGTSLKYKISFANQASGTKEARIRGVALQY